MCLDRYCVQFAFLNEWLMVTADVWINPVTQILSEKILIYIIGYIITGEACVYGIDEIVDSPKRILVVWARQLKCQLYQIDCTSSHIRDILHRFMFDIVLPKRDSSKIYASLQLAFQLHSWEKFLFWLWVVLNSVIRFQFTIPSNL